MWYQQIWSFIKKYERTILIGIIVLLLFIVVIVGMKKEGYASQEVHAYAGNMAGPFTDWDKYYGIENYEKEGGCNSCGQASVPKKGFEKKNMGNQDYYEIDPNPLQLRPFGCPGSCPYGCVQGIADCPYK